MSPFEKPSGKRDPFEGFSDKQRKDMEDAVKRGQAAMNKVLKHTDAKAAENEALYDDLLKKNEQEIDDIKKKTGGKYEKF